MIVDRLTVDRLVLGDLTPYPKTDKMLSLSIRSRLKWIGGDMTFVLNRVSRRLEPFPLKMSFNEKNAFLASADNYRE